MLHIGPFDIKTEIVIFAAALAVFFFQLLLLFKVKNKLLRLLPTVLFLLLTLTFAVLTFVFESWDRFAFLVLTIYSAVPLMASVTAILIHALFRLIKRCRTQKEDDGGL